MDELSALIHAGVISESVISNFMTMLNMNIEIDGVFNVVF
jgi:hypothetical protein